jgi:hypothetical protein
MSWKLLVSAGLLCVVVSPVLAAPTLTVDLLRTAGGLPILDPATGNWQWVVSVTPDSTLFAAQGAQGTGGSIATELGFTASGAALQSVTKNATNFPNDDPGASLGAGFPTNTATTALGVQTLGNNAAVNLGSDFFTTATAKQEVIIQTKKPATVAANGSLTTTLAWLGAYGTGSNKGRIAQGAGNPGGGNFDTFAGTLTKTAHTGDANLDGHVDGLDLATIASTFGATGKIWSQADYTGDGKVDGLDLAEIAGAFGFSGTAPGGGAGVSGAVPEPASIVLLTMAGIGALVIRRKRG